MKKTIAALILLGVLATACGGPAAAPTATPTAGAGAPTATTVPSAQAPTLVPTETATSAAPPPSATVDSPALPGPNCDDDQTGTRVLVVVLDGVRPDYLDLVPMPNLEGIEQEGTSYEHAWVGQLINVTPPSHATINTGVFPRRHSVVGFEWSDRFGRWITLFGGIGEGRLSRLIIQSGVPTLADLVRQLYPCAHSVAIAGSKVHAAAAMGGRTSADWILYASTSKQPTAEGWLQYSDVQPAAVRGHEPPDGILQHTALYELGPLGPEDLDRWIVDVALMLLQRYQPRLLMVNLAAADIVGHATGGITDPDRMSGVMASLDKELGRLIDWYRQEGILQDTIIVVTSDHGMVPNERNVEPGAIFKALKDSGTGRQRSVTAWTHIWLTDPSKAREAAEAISMLQDPAILGVYYKEPGDGNYLLALGSKLEEPMRATLSCLLSTYAGPTSPDLVIILRENTLLGKSPEGSHGSHGVITWGAQHIVLTIYGPGIKEGKVSDYPARLVDIVPTVASLMGLIHQDWDGIVLADAYEKPASEELVVQQNEQRELGSLVYALCAQSAVDGGVPTTECESIAR